MKKKKLIVIPLMLILFLANTVMASASSQVPYHTYNYDYWYDVVYTPAAYIPGKRLSGDDLEIGGFNSPQDFFINDKGIYIADTGNNRLIILNNKMHISAVINEFTNDQGAPDKFKEPKGICVTEDGLIYVADSGNKRVVVVDSRGKFVKKISDPKSEVLPADYTFVPLKVSVDYAGRVYVIAQNMFQGIMAFDELGNFTGFTGTINVSLSPYEIFWRRILTRDQKDRGKLFVPTEFTGMDIDVDGFLYATNVDSKGKKSVRLINPKGQDVIVGKDELSGDKNWWGFGQYGGASRIEDIVEREKGLYTMLDSLRGRIFTYDSEGNLLYIFGGLGKQNGTLKTPTAIDTFGDKILVLDAGRNEIISYEPTEYGRLINEAVGLRYDGDEAEAVEKWREVLKLDSNFELAYIGIGKSYLTAGDNKKAMEYLELGRDRDFYSVAFKRYRNEILLNNLEYALTIGLILVFVLPITSKILKMRKRRKANV